VRVDVENVSNKSLRWRLSGRLAPSEPKKRFKAARRAGLGAVERVLKTAPKGAVFCRYFTGTETYAVILSL
jgi:hypothetical protein